jgi:trimeric autotransporter adhesin
MQTWARRGIQTALMTGGMLAVGAGIASAAEHCADRPCTPLDGGAQVPIDIDDNAVGTPVGEVDLPGVHRQIGTDEVGQALPEALRAPAGRLTAPLAGATEPTGKHALRPTHDQYRGGALRDNHADTNLVVPVQIEGNALALGGNVAAHNDSYQSAANSRDTTANGDGGVLSGNVLGLDGAVPVQLDGNAIALLGNAATDNHSGQDATAGGGVFTSGDHGVLSGNAILGQIAAPVQGDGNAIGLLGNANAKSTAESSAHAPGAVSTSGDDATLSGNALGAPLGVPVGLNGNAIGGAGNAKSYSDTTAEAIAGSTVLGKFGLPTYVRTSGDHSTVSGNGGELPVSGPVELDGNALSAVGNTLARGSADKHTVAGGGVDTSGVESTGSGSTIEGPVALPIQGFGNGGAVLGNADGGFDNATNSTAGGNVFTNGDHSVLSSEGVNVPPAGAVDVFGNAGSVLGNVAGRGSNTTSATTGGYTGTTGNDATGSGNVISTPLAPPVEGFGLAGGLLGNATADGVESDKDIHSGDGTVNTNDDGGTLSSNVVGGATAAPVQAFGDAAGWIANVRGHGTNNTSTTAGGNVEAKGTKGTGSGNIVFGSLAEPAQLFGVASSTIGNADGAALNRTYAAAGGSNVTDGLGGAGSGNVVDPAGAGASQVFGDALAWFGLAHATGANATDSYAGRDATSSGDDGALSGNVLSPAVLNFGQVFGDTVSAAGIGDSFGADETNAAAGGNSKTSGRGGALAGDILSAPVAAKAPQVFGDALAVGGLGRAAGFSDNQGQVGGGNATSDPERSLSGRIVALPAIAEAELFDVPIEVLGRAMATGRDGDEIRAGEERSNLELPVGGDGLGAAELPTFAALQDGRHARSGLPPVGLPLPAPELPTLPLPLPQSFGARSAPGAHALEDTQQLPVVGGQGARLSGMQVNPGGVGLDRYTRFAQSPALPAVGPGLLGNLGDGGVQVPRI